MAKNAWSVLVGVELDTNAQKIQQQLNKISKDLKVDIDTKDAKNGVDSLTQSVEDLSLSYQAANAILSKSIEIISSMVNEVYALDTALTEYKKVSDLSGKSLDNYVTKLANMGNAVARTGKPKSQAPDDGIVNQHQEPLEIQYNLRAYSTTMIA